MIQSQFAFLEISMTCSLEPLTLCGVIFAIIGYGVIAMVHMLKYPAMIFAISGI